MTTKTVEAITALLNVYADSPDCAMSDELDALSNCAIKEGIVNWYIAGGYTVPNAEAPPVPAISPVTVNAIAESINVNAAYVLGKACGALSVVRDCMVRDGLIARVDGDGCMSLVGKVSEAPAVPIDWLGDDFDF
jgi:hypothetical protein